MVWLYALQVIASDDSDATVTDSHPHQMVVMQQLLNHPSDDLMEMESVIMIDVVMVFKTQNNLWFQFLECSTKMIIDDT